MHAVDNSNMGNSVAKCQRNVWELSENFLWCWKVVILSFVVGRV